MCTGEALDGANGFANEVLVLGVDPPVKMNGLFVTGANWLVLPNTADRFTLITLRGCGANWLVLPNTAALSSSEKIEPVALFPLLTKESLHDGEQKPPWRGHSYL